MLTVLHQTAPGVLRTDSITSEKIAVALFREVFSCEESFPPETYEQLSWVYRIYETFKIRCGGKERLLQAFEDGTAIRNVETFIWFSKQSDIYHQVFQGFDVMDSKWDPLAKALEAKQYLSLFDFCLREDMTPEEIRQRLERYQALTGETYTDIFWKTSYSDRFGLLVSKGILNLWDLFRNSLDETGSSIQREMRSHIWRCCRKIQNIQAYQFMEEFFAVYGVSGLERFFGNDRRDFFEALTKRRHYSNEPLLLDLRRDYLNDAGRRQLLQWLEEYVFMYQSETYLDLLTAILRDETVAALFSSEEQRKLFDMAARGAGTRRGILNELKCRYLTEEELQAEQDAEAAARQAAEQRQQKEMEESIRENYSEFSNGSFASAIKFLDEYKYYRDKRPIACRIMREHLDGLLESRSYELDSQEAARFLCVCGKLVIEKAMSFTEAQSCITRVKECNKNDN